MVYCVSVLFYIESIYKLIADPFAMDSPIIGLSIAKANHKKLSKVGKKT